MFVATQGLASSQEYSQEGVAPVIPLHALPNQGLLPVGTLIEISGPEAHHQAARILARNRNLCAAWIEQNLEALPETTFHSQINLKKVLFINGQRDSSWAASQIINSGLFPILIFSAPYENEKLLRRLRRQARKSGTTVLLLRDKPCFSWTIRVHLHAQEAKLNVLRWRKQ